MRFDLHLAALHEYSDDSSSFEQLATATVVMCTSLLPGKALAASMHDWHTFYGCKSTSSRSKYCLGSP